MGVGGSPTCDGGVATGAFFGIKAAEAADAVGTLPLRCEGLPSQRGAAAAAQEALFMPHLLLVGHAPFSQRLRDRKQLPSDEVVATADCLSFPHQM